MPWSVQSVHEGVVEEQKERTTNRGVGKIKMGGKMSHAERGARMSQASRGKNSQCEQIKGLIDTYEEENCDDEGCTVDDKWHKKVRKVRRSLKARAGMTKDCEKQINNKIDDIEKRRKKIQPDIKF